MTHWRSAAEKSRSRWIDGSATLTTVASRMTMNCARQTMTRTSQRFVSPAGGDSTGSGRSETDWDDTADLRESGKGAEADAEGERGLGTVATASARVPALP